MLLLRLPRAEEREVVRKSLRPRLRSWEVMTAHPVTRSEVEITMRALVVSQTRGVREIEATQEIRGMLRFETCGTRSSSLRRVQVRVQDLPRAEGPLAAETNDKVPQTPVIAEIIAMEGEIMLVAEMDEALRRQVLGIAGADPLRTSPATWAEGWVVIGTQEALIVQGVVIDARQSTETRKGLLKLGNILHIVFLYFHHVFTCLYLFLRVAANNQRLSSSRELSAVAEVPRLIMTPPLLAT